jgi:hypothetical protein
LIAQPEVTEIDDQSKGRAKVLQDDHLGDLWVVEETEQPEEAQSEVQPKEEVVSSFQEVVSSFREVVKQLGRAEIPVKAPPENGINLPSYPGRALAHHRRSQETRKKARMRTRHANGNEAMMYPRFQETRIANVGSNLATSIWIRMGADDVGGSYQPVRVRQDWASAWCRPERERRRMGWSLPEMLEPMRTDLIIVTTCDK